MNIVFNVLAVLLTLCCVGCVCSQPVVVPRRLVVLSYNIHHGAGMDQRLDLARIAEVIKSVSPDIVSLQEVDRATARSEGVDQAAELARLTGMTFRFGASMPFAGGEYGNAVLTRHAITDFEVVSLPGEPRSALCVTLELQNGESPERIRFIATHLDTGKEPRLASIPLIESALKEKEDLPTVLAGDLNAVPGGPAMSVLAETWQNATVGDELLTVPVVTPSIQIDYVLYRPSERWRRVNARVLDEAMASDHRPILAILELMPGQR